MKKKKRSHFLMTRSLYLSLILPYLICSWFSVEAQRIGEVVLFNKDGKEFHVELNGERINAEPASRIELKNLEHRKYRLKVLFTDSVWRPMEAFLYTQPGKEVVYSIQRSTNDRYRLKAISNSALSSGSTEMKNTPAATEHTEPGGGSSQTQETVVHTTSTMTVQSGDSTVHKQTTSTTVITTTNSTGNKDTLPTPPIPGYSGPTGCVKGYLADDMFQQVKESIADRSFEDDKLALAKQIAKDNCLTSQQVKEIMLLMDFEESRLEFAKYAFAHTYDQGNFFMVHEAFDFSSSSDELKEYISE